jgi:hypothetical protein
MGPYTARAGGRPSIFRATFVAAQHALAARIPFGVSAALDPSRKKNCFEPSTLADAGIRAVRAVHVAIGMSHAFEVDWNGTQEEGPVFHAGREFGTTEAAELRQRLAELGAGIPVRVDFTRTVDLSDHALAELLEWVVDRQRGHVAFVGLNAHHERMLRYLVPRAAEALIP